MKTISVEELKDRIEKADMENFHCVNSDVLQNIKCSNCIFQMEETGCDILKCNYDFKAIFSHDFSPKTEITIDDLKPFKI